MPYVLHHLATTGCPLITLLMCSLCLSAGGHMVHFTCNHEFHVFNVSCQNLNVLLNVYMCICLNSYADIVPYLNPYTIVHLMMQCIYTRFQEETDKRLKSITFLLHTHIKTKQKHITTYLMTWKREGQSSKSPVIEKLCSVSNFMAEHTQGNTKWINHTSALFFRIVSESSFAIYRHVLLSINGQCF